MWLYKHVYSLFANYNILFLIMQFIDFMGVCSFSILCVASLQKSPFVGRHESGIITD